jgi:hypothetical protein
MQHLVDIDGDGVVDADELALWQMLQEVKGVDADGNGTVDDSETYVERQIVGRRLMAEKFVNRQQGKMWRFHSKFIGMTSQEIINEIYLAEDFTNAMSFLKAKEHRLRQESGTFTLGKDTLYKNCLLAEGQIGMKDHEQGSVGYSHNHHSVAPWVQATQRTNRGRAKIADATQRQNLFLQRATARGAQTDRVPTPLRVTEQGWKSRGGNAMTGNERQWDPNQTDKRYETHLGKIGQAAGLPSEPAKTNFLPDKRTVRVANNWQAEYKPGEAGGWPFQAGSS